MTDMSEIKICFPIFNLTVMLTPASGCWDHSYCVQQLQTTDNRQQTTNIIWTSRAAERLIIFSRKSIAALIGGILDPHSFRQLFFIIFLDIFHFLQQKNKQFFLGPNPIFSCFQMVDGFPSMVDFSTMVGFISHKIIVIIFHNKKLNNFFIIKNLTNFKNYYQCDQHQKRFHLSPTCWFRGQPL